MTGVLSLTYLPATILLTEDVDMRASSDFREGWRKSDLPKCGSYVLHSMGGHRRISCSFIGI